LPPIVSIITAVKNNKEFIEDAIKSVLGQTYPNIEYIVIDGSSTDGTFDIIKKYQSKISKCISEPDNGIFDALNKGIKNSTGDIICFLHSDDILANDKVIEKIAHWFISTNADVVYSDLVYVSKKNINKVIRYWKAGKFSAKSLKFGWMPPHPAMFVKRSLYDKYGLFDIGLKIASDYDIILRLLKNSPDTIFYTQEVFVKMRLGGKSNRSFKNIMLKSKEDYRALRNNGFSSPAFTLFFKNVRKLNQFLIVKQ
jgi:glycosyltransferase